MLARIRFEQNTTKLFIKSHNITGSNKSSQNLTPICFTPDVTVTLLTVSQFLNLIMKFSSYQL